jgi:hypothetical protein
MAPRAISPAFSYVDQSELSKDGTLGTPLPVRGRTVEDRPESKKQICAP